MGRHVVIELAGLESFTGTAVELAAGRDARVTGQCVAALALHALEIGFGFLVGHRGYS